ncbi:hypothetical protein ScPMuIL_016007 [Solemya velum]
MLAGHRSDRRQDETYGRYYVSCGCTKMVHDLDGFTFGVDLAKAAIKHLSFLRRVNKQPHLQSGNSLRRAIRRYEEQWLPLAAIHKDVILSAPLDIAWVWHCHLLAPAAYENDCLRLFGVVVQHSCDYIDDSQEKRERAEHLWNKFYPNDPFEIPLEHDAPVGNQSEFSSRLSYDIEAAAARQKLFYYQVSLPHFKDPNYLDLALGRYRKFLFLRQQNPGVFLVPCYGIDLMWHTHILNPLVYKEDTVRLTGSLFNHDDTTNDRSPESKLCQASAETRQIWHSTFGKKYAFRGAMYRGDPPFGKLQKMEDGYNFKLTTKVINIAVKNIEILGMKPSVKNFKIQFYQPLNRLGDSKIVFFKVTGPERVWNGDTKRLVQPFDIDTSTLRRMHVQVCEKQMFLCMVSASTEIAKGNYDIQKSQNNIKGLNCPVKDSRKINLTNGLTVKIEQTVTAVREGKCVLDMKPGQYESCIMPENIEQLWGPVPLPNLPPGTDNVCSVASHGLLDMYGNVTFTCRIIHSIPLMMSAIHVFHHDRMVVVGHLIGADQLPLPSMVKDNSKCPTLNPRSGERAMLLKNHDGDWGVVFGRWEGRKKGIPGTRTRKGTPGCPGFLHVRFHKIGEPCQDVSLESQYKYENFTFKVGACEVNLEDGNIKMPAGNAEVPEHVALAFAVSLLHVLCVPRPGDWEPGHSLTLTSKAKRGGLKVKTTPSESLAFVLAAGVLLATASNHFLGKRRREAKHRKRHSESSTDQTSSRNVFHADWLGGAGGITEDGGTLRTDNEEMGSDERGVDENLNEELGGDDESGVDENAGEEIEENDMDDVSGNNDFDVDDEDVFGDEDGPDFDDGESVGDFYEDLDEGGFDADGGEDGDGDCGGGCGGCGGGDGDGGGGIWRGVRLWRRRRVGMWGWQWRWRRRRVWWRRRWWRGEGAVVVAAMVEGEGAVVAAAMVAAVDVVAADVEAADVEAN